MQKLIILPLFLLFLTACSPKVWEKTPDGVLIHPKSKAVNGAKTVSLQVISDRIIRVVASPDNQLSNAKSLCVVENKALPATFSVVEQNDSLILTTAKVKVKVSMASGEVKFYDENNQVILQDRNHGKSFIPITVEGT